MKKLTQLALLTTILVPTAAFAQINVGDSLGSTEDAVRAALEAQGYAISEIEVEDDEIEVDAMLDGMEYEIEVSAETGMVVEIEQGDEDDSDDEDEDDKEEG